MHSEELADQELSVAKSEALSAEFAASIPYFKDSGFARSHWEVVARFGRFPHRNAAKGRASTAEEAAWLAGPGVPGWARSQG